MFGRWNSGTKASAPPSDPESSGECREWAATKSMRHVRIGVGVLCWLVASLVLATGHGDGGVAIWHDSKAWGYLGSRYDDASYSTFHARRHDLDRSLPRFGYDSAHRSLYSRHDMFAERHRGYSTRHRFRAGDKHRRYSMYYRFNRQSKFSRGLNPHSIRKSRFTGAHHSFHHPHVAVHSTRHVSRHGSRGRGIRHRAKFSAGNRNRFR